MVLGDITNLVRAREESPGKQFQENDYQLNFTPDSKAGYRAELISLPLRSPSELWPVSEERRVPSALQRFRSVPAINALEAAANSFTAPQHFGPRPSLEPHSAAPQGARARSETAGLARPSLGGRSFSARRTSMDGLPPEARLRALGGEPERIGQISRQKKINLGPPQRTHATAARARTPRSPRSEVTAWPEDSAQRRCKSQHADGRPTTGGSAQDRTLASTKLRCKSQGAPACDRNLPVNTPRPQAARSASRRPAESMQRRPATARGAGAAKGAAVRSAAPVAGRWRF
eukprot:TRINITY_DN38931_c0_g1_i1.p1 TRINITY_DN38931_c0_g1~~TRINITY_DN38931_c0_g1_i1.p1  ORF type:complete len:289 (+),score=37.29 TRINITY_DN38931_c0_g1_i1:29-895(+)